MTPMLKQYFAIKEQHKDAILLFHLGDFYEMFGDDAKTASSLLDLTLTARGKGTDNEIPMCGVPIKASPQYIARLTKLGHKVAICEQVTAPDGTGIVKREVTQVVTPGTTFDDSVLEQKQSNFLASIVADSDQYGLAIVDATTGKFQTALYDNLESLKEDLYRIAPSEVLLSGIELQIDAFSQSYSLPNWIEAQKVLEEHFKVKGLDAFGIDQEDLLKKSCATVLQYLKETQKTSLSHIKSIERLQAGDSMLLDEATIRNLELFSNQQTGAKEGSLYHTIDYTQTAMGGRMLGWWMLHPLLNKKSIQERLDAVDVLFKSLNDNNLIREELKAICDLERLIGKIGVERVNPRDVYNVKETIKRIPEIKKNIPKGSELLDSINSELNEHQEVISEIQRVLVSEPPVLMQDGGYIAQGVDPELDELRVISKSGKDWINDLQIKERKRTGISSLKVKYNRVFGYYIEVSKANLDAVPEEYIRKQTLVNAERFITPELKEYEEKVLGAQDKILLLEQQIFEQLRAFLLDHLAGLQKTANALAKLDVLSSFAHLAQMHGYHKPELVDEGIIEIVQGRHPVIEKLQSDPYIANDLLMGVDLNGRESDFNRFLLLTGPNMSGKSSYLRQNALIVLLAQIGSFVPAKAMRFAPVDRIFTRVGASDNLSKGRSTFMVEMQEAAYILRQATEHSLIILDELGRGTSTYDGLSLAWAISEFLHDAVKAKTLFATHYHELIEVIQDLDHAANYSVAVAEDENGVVFLHQVLEGGINKSYGIEVGKLAGLPQNIILRSKDILTRLEQHTWEGNSSKEKQQSLPLMPVKQSLHPVVKKLKELDINSITPIEALQTLYEYKQECNKDPRPKSDK